MNINIRPEVEFDMMQRFFMQGGALEEMPEELRRTHIVWKRADELLRRYPHYDNEQIAKQIMADFPEYEMKMPTAKKHVTEAKKYFDTVETDTPATIRRKLSDVAFRQIEALKKQQENYPEKFAQISKVIESWANRIASINKVYDNENIDEQAQQGDIFLVVSSDSTQFPDIPDVTEAEIVSMIEKVTKAADLTEEEKQTIIDKDVKGNVI